MNRNYIPSIAAGAALLIAAMVMPIAGQQQAQLINAQANKLCVDPPDGITNWWDGDSVNGTTAEDIVGAANGTMTGATVVPGKVGQAFSFAGNNLDANGNLIPNTGTFIRLPQNFFPYPTTQSGNLLFTFELWFNTTRDGVIFGQQCAKPFDGLVCWVPPIYVGTDGELGVEMFWDGRPPINTGRGVRDGQWHHVAVVYDGTMETVFLDGANVGSTEKRQDPYTQVYHYQLGTGSDTFRKGSIGGWHSFKGEIDEFTVYNKALSTGEIQSIVDAGEFGKCKVECGNNFIQDNEVCDGSDLGGETCESQLGAGFNGPLGCKSDCSDYDTTQCAAPALCNDGIDNDADGKIDFPSDPGCSSSDDGDETDPPPPPINRNITFQKSASPQIIIQPALGEREVLVLNPPCPTCTINTTPDHTQFIGGTPAADQGFVIIAQSLDSTDNSLTYSIIAVNPVDESKPYTEHTQLFTEDGKEYTNYQR